MELTGIRVWIDALTPKQARLAIYLAELLEKDGAEVVVTVREYEYTRYVAEFFKRKLGVRAHIHVVGRHGKSLQDKLIADVERMRILASTREVIDSDILVSYPSPSAVRVAFGLGKRIIILSDSPHSVAVHRLTCMLADVLIHSALIPRHYFSNFLTRFNRVYTYMGFDEILWLVKYKPSCKPPLDNIAKRNYIVIRSPERHAAYYNVDVSVFDSVVCKACRYWPAAVLLPRYIEDSVYYERLLSRCGCEVYVLDWRSALDALDLVYHASIVLTGGGTLAREAATLGVPSVYSYPAVLNKALESLGLPLIHVSKVEDEFLSNPPRSSIAVGKFETPYPKLKTALLEVLETPRQG